MNTRLKALGKPPKNTVHSLALATFFATTLPPSASSSSPSAATPAATHATAAAFANRPGHICVVATRNLTLATTLKIDVVFNGTSIIFTLVVRMKCQWPQDTDNPICCSSPNGFNAVVICEPLHMSHVIGGLCAWSNRWNEVHQYHGDAIRMSSPIRSFHRNLNLIPIVNAQGGR